MRSPGRRACRADATSSTTAPATGSPTPVSATGSATPTSSRPSTPAGNTASDSATVTPSADASTKHLLSPGAASSLSRPPMLRWRKIARASYYNVQLFRNGKKILSAWPTKPHYQLRRVWTLRGQAPSARARRRTGGCCGPGTGTAASTATASCWASARSSSAEARHNPGVRCLYVDLDGTLLGAGGAVTRDGEGRFTLLGMRALEACHRAQGARGRDVGPPAGGARRGRAAARDRRVRLRGGRRLRGRR